MNEPVPNQTTKQSVSAISLTEAQRMELQNALLHPGEPSSEARFQPLVKGKRKHRSVKGAARETTDHCLTITGIV